jgi:riboflavin kinase/FMN adenylyltransferase
VIIHRSVQGLKREARQTVVAVGNFDGVHRGHQAVIGEAVRRARAEGVPASVLTFEPHPRRFFQPKVPPFLLARFRAKARVIATLGVERLFALRFNTALAGRTAEEFVDTVLSAGLEARHVVVGYDFVFGKGRADLLRDRLAQRGIGVTIMPAVTVTGTDRPAGVRDGLVVSSTGVRDALRSGDPQAAAWLLGRPFEIEGRVRQGERRGRQLGFPTANLGLGEYLRPALGIYAVRVAIAERAVHAGAALREATVWRDGVASLGLNPTFGGLPEPQLEANLFDFSGDIYGRRLRVALLGYLRPERKFDDSEDLRVQIARDAEDAQRFLAALPPGKAS